MEPRPGETSGGQPAGTEAPEHTVGYDTTTFRPVFSPAARQADDDTGPDDVDAQAQAVAEPAGNYPGDDDVDEPDVDEPAGALPAMEADEPTGNYTHAEAGGAAPVYEAPVGHETWATAAAEPVAATPAADDAPPAPVALADLEKPLLSTDTELLAQWQRAQVGFINDPHAAVASAADLVEQAGRALVTALEERQRQMRTMWDHSSVNGPTAQAGIKADTEQLRQMMQRYHALFSQLYQSA